MYVMLHHYICLLDLSSDYALNILFYHILYPTLLYNHKHMEIFLIFFNRS